MFVFKCSLLHDFQYYFCFMKLLMDVKHYEKSYLKRHENNLCTHGSSFNTSTPCNVKLFLKMTVIFFYNHVFRFYNYQIIKIYEWRA